MFKSIRYFLALTFIAAQPIAMAEETPRSIPKYQTANHWFKDAQKALQEKQKQLGMKAPEVKNIILFVGDGMGVSTVTAARILEGQLRGDSGEENQLSFEKMPFTGLSKTYNVNAQTPDSA